MPTDFTPAELRAVFTIDSTDASKHARCGNKARCRLDAIAKVDEDLDAWLESMALSPVPDVGAGAVNGG